MITVYPCTTDICQLRLDFLEFSLSQPNASGVCDNDFLLIAGAARTYPRICGENAGQHGKHKFILHSELFNKFN